MKIKPKESERVEPYCFPLGKPVNRKQKRLVNHEINFIASHLNLIEFQFARAWFDEELDLSYNWLYTHFKNKFDDMVKQLIINKRFKYTFFNTGYFAAHYKAVES
jgi:hypothetical protein